LGVRGLRIRGGPRGAHRDAGADAPTPGAPVIDPMQILLDRGGEADSDEPVTHLEHALLTAGHALAAGAGPALVAAALFHDIGQLLHPDADRATRAGLDTRHEELGARFLSRFFGEAVCAPVRLHVAAKRELARDPDYRARLSPVSLHSLAVQGGPFSAIESAAFLALPGATDALLLRRWDDAAKDPTAPLPDPDRLEVALAAARTLTS